MDSLPRRSTARQHRMCSAHAATSSPLTAEMRAMGARPASSAARLVPRARSAVATTLTAVFWEAPLHPPPVSRLCVARQERARHLRAESSRESVL